MKTHNRWCLLAVALLLAASGCGGPLVTVTGRLTYKGEPVPSTTVKFCPDEEGKRPSQGVTDDQGNFTPTNSITEKGALRGKHTVVLKYHLGADEEMGKVAPRASRELKEIIARYGDVKKSPLHYAVTKSGQFIEINLEQ
jgi:hypothetical protein